MTINYFLSRVTRGATLHTMGQAVPDDMPPDELAALVRAGVAGEAPPDWSASVGDAIVGGAGLAGVVLPEVPPMVHAAVVEVLTAAGIAASVPADLPARMRHIYAMGSEPLATAGRVRAILAGAYPAASA